MKIAALVSMMVLAIGLPLASAATPNSQSNIRIVPPSALPDSAQQPSQDLFVHAAGNGTSYLYLEQGRGARLAILDVTVPARIRLAATVDTGIEKPFDFVQPVGSDFELIRFRDGSGSALLNLQKPESPRVENVEWTTLEPVEALGDSGFLAVALQTSRQPFHRAQRDIHVLSSDHLPHLLTTVEGVTRTAELQETGTVFLLGSRGLTVVRCLDKEQRYATEQLVMSHN